MIPGAQLKGFLGKVTLISKLRKKACFSLCYKILPSVQGCIAVKNLFEFSIKVKFFRTTAREVKDKFF